MVEAENSSLVLENEQQRQQYEKCLDEIANQVVQALLAQKVIFFLLHSCLPIKKKKIQISISFSSSENLVKASDLNSIKNTQNHNPAGV